MPRRLPLLGLSSSGTPVPGTPVPSTPGPSCLHLAHVQCTGRLVVCASVKAPPATRSRGHRLQTPALFCHRPGRSLHEPPLEGRQAEFCGRGWEGLCRRASGLLSGLCCPDLPCPVGVCLSYRLPQEPVSSPRGPYPSRRLPSPAPSEVTPPASGSARRCLVCNSGASGGDFCAAPMTRPESCALCACGTPRPIPTTASACCVPDRRGTRNSNQAARVMWLLTADDVSQILIKRAKVT